jgi:hypothetical protein
LMLLWKRGDNGDFQGFMGNQTGTINTEPGRRYNISRAAAPCHGWRQGILMKSSFTMRRRVGELDHKIRCKLS